MSLNLIVSPYPAYRLAIKAIFKRIQPDGKTECFENIYSIPHQVRTEADILVYLCHQNSIDELYDLIYKHRSTRCILLSNWYGETHQRLLKNRIVNKVLPLSVSCQRLEQQVRLLVAGEPSINSSQAIDKTYKKSGFLPDLSVLTKMELRTLECLCQGYSNELISQYLTVSENTAKIHVRRVIEKTGALNRTQAASIYSFYLANEY